MVNIHFEDFDDEHNLVVLVDGKELKIYNNKYILLLIPDPCVFNNDHEDVDWDDIHYIPCLYNSEIDRFVGLEDIFDWDHLWIWESMFRDIMRGMKFETYLKSRRYNRQNQG